MTTDEEGIEAVVREARREREDPWADPRWEALADGTISPADRAELEALAAQPGPYADAMAAFAPLSTSFKAQVADALLGASNGARAAAAAPATPVVSLDTHRAKAARRARSWLTAGSGLVALAAAASIAIMWSPGGQVRDLPAYAMQLSEGAQGTRGTKGPSALPEFFPDTTFELIARPASPAEGEVTAAGVLVGNGVRVRWSPRVDRSSDGALRVRGATREVLPVGPGEWTLLLVVGRPAEVERVATALELSDEGAAQASVLSARLRVSPSRP